MRKSIKKILHRSFILSIALPAIFILSAIKAMSADVDEALGVLLSSPSIDSTATSLLVWDLKSDLPVAAYRECESAIPASVMKCVTSGALTQILPCESTYKTKVYLCARQTGEDLEGYLRIAGGGDPSLGDGRHEGCADFIKGIVGIISGMDVKAIRGDIIIDDSMYEGPSAPSSWLAEDRRQAYGTGFHAFNYEGNASGKKSVDSPSSIFRQRLINSLSGAGITFTEVKDITPALAKESLIMEYESPEMEMLVRSCMFRSDNLYAESFLRLFGKINGGDGAPDTSAEIALQHWEALNFKTDGIRIIDGSGLSRENRLTAEFLGMVLRYRSTDPDYVSFFPLVGEEGTVKKFMSGTPLEGRLALKTGSMNGIQSYAGYLLDGEYRPTHVVVVIANGLKNRTEFRSALSKFLTTVFT